MIIVFFTTLALALMLVATGEILGTRFPLVRRVHLPGAVTGGILGLLLGPQVLLSGLDFSFSTQTREIFSTLSDFPAWFINLVFACLLLGKPFDNLRSLWTRAQPHVIMGHVIAWGQYVVGLILTLFILIPFFGLSEFISPVIAIGFQGGHGTAAGLGKSFSNAGFEDGKSVAMAVATIGIVFATVIGPLIARFLSHRYQSQAPQPPEEVKSAHGEEKSESSTEQYTSLTGKLTLHLAAAALVILLGRLALFGIQFLEKHFKEDTEGMLISEFIPLFSLVLICGMIVQILCQAFSWTDWMDRELFNRISAFGLDLVIVSGLATLSLSALSEHLFPILILSLGGLSWNLCVMRFLGPKLFHRHWPAHALGDLGGGTATTATGLMLIRVVDPHNWTPAKQAYSEKQPFYEPIMGGGLVTALALPALMAFGPWICLGITGSILALWLAYGLFVHYSNT